MIFLHRDRKYTVRHLWNAPGHNSTERRNLPCDHVKAIIRQSWSQGTLLRKDWLEIEDDHGRTQYLFF